MELFSIVILIAALAAGAIVKGATGMGLPLIALPVLTSAFGLQHAVGLMTIPLIVTNVWQVWRFRAEMRGPHLGFMPWFLTTGAVGIGIGTLALTAFPERVLVQILGFLLIAYVAMRLAKPHWTLSPPHARRLAPVAGTAAGILQGATGISSPVGVTFIHAMTLDRATHIFAVSAMFLLFSVVQLPSLWIAGVMQTDWLLQGMLALIPILVFMPVGQWASGKLSREAFDRTIMVFLGAIGVKMALGL